MKVIFMPFLLKKLLFIFILLILPFDSVFAVYSELILRLGSSKKPGATFCFEYVADTTDQYNSWIKNEENSVVVFDSQNRNPHKYADYYLGYKEYDSLKRVVGDQLDDFDFSDVGQGAYLVVRFQQHACLENGAVRRMSEKYADNNIRWVKLDIGVDNRVSAALSWMELKSQKNINRLQVLTLHIIERKADKGESQYPFFMAQQAISYVALLGLHSDCDIPREACAFYKAPNTKKRDMIVNVQRNCSTIKLSCLRKTGTDAEKLALLSIEYLFEKQETAGHAADFDGLLSGLLCAETKMVFGSDSDVFSASSDMDKRQGVKRKYDDALNESTETAGLSEIQDDCDKKYAVFKEVVSNLGILLQNYCRTALDSKLKVDKEKEWSSYEERVNEKIRSLFETFREGLERKVEKRLDLAANQTISKRDHQGAVKKIPKFSMGRNHMLTTMRNRLDKEQKNDKTIMDHIKRIRELENDGDTSYDFNKSLLLLMRISYISGWVEAVESR